jgi:hypothetical protein
VRDSYDNQVATALDISPDGSRTVILTYRQAFEWNQDLALIAQPLPQLTKDRDYSVTDLAPLPQAEAVAYLPDGDAIIYTSETAGTGGDAEIYRQTCTRR